MTPTTKEIEARFRAGNFTVYPHLTTINKITTNYDGTYDRLLHVHGLTMGMMRNGIPYHYAGDVCIMRVYDARAGGTFFALLSDHFDTIPWGILIPRSVLAANIQEGLDCDPFGEQTLTLPTYKKGLDASLNIPADSVLPLLSVCEQLGVFADPTTTLIEIETIMKVTKDKKGRIRMSAPFHR